MPFNAVPTAETEVLPHEARRMLENLYCQAASEMPGLLEVLAGKDPWYRVLAADALAPDLPAADTAIPVLTAALRDENPWVREAAGAALVRLDAANHELTEEWLRCLDDADAGVRLVAYQGLTVEGLLGNPKIVQALLLRVSHEHRFMRQALGDAVAVHAVADQTVLETILNRHVTDQITYSYPLRQILRRTLTDAELTRRVEAILQHLPWSTLEPMLHWHKMSMPLVESLLLPQLLQTSSKIRLEVLRVLESVVQGGPALSPALQQVVARCLATGMPDLHYTCAQLLKRQGTTLTDATVATLISYLDHLDEQIRTSVLSSFEELVGSRKEVHESVLRCFADLQPKVRTRAAMIMRQPFIDALDPAPALRSLLEDPDPDCRQWAASSLGHLEANNESTRNALLHCTTDAEARVRSWAVMALGRFGVGPDAVLGTAASLLNDPDSDVRKQAAQALGTLGVANDNTISALLMAVADSDVEVVARAYRALGALGLPAPEVLAALQGCRSQMSQASPWHRADLAKALVQLGVVDVELAGWIIEGIDSGGSMPWDFLRMHLQPWLPLLGKAAVVAAVDRLEDSDWRMRALAAAILGYCGRQDEGLDQRLRELVDTDLDLRPYTVRTLVQWGQEDQDLQDSLVADLRDAEEFTVGGALETLSYLKHPLDSTRIAVLRCLRHQIDGVRAQACVTLLSWGRRGADLEAAIALQVESDDWWSRRIALTGIERGGMDTPAVRTALYRTLRRDNGKVWADALQVLVDLGERSPVLVQAASDLECAESSEVVSAIGKLAVYDPRCADSLLSALGDPSLPRRLAASAALVPAVRAHPGIRERVELLCHDARYRTRKVAISVLERANELR